MSTREHWNDVYAKKEPTSVSWHRTHLEQSLTWVEDLGLPRTAHIVDIGGGASTFVDDLLDQGFESVSVADISAQALEHSKRRLGPRTGQVRWVVGDVTEPLFPDDSVDLWHDRAVFHFLTSPSQQGAYRAQVLRCVRPGGVVIIATFAPDGPERCSGLQVARYAPQEIAAAMGPGFELLQEAAEEHSTPKGSPQAFAYALLRRLPT